MRGRYQTAMASRAVNSMRGNANGVLVYLIEDSRLLRDGLATMLRSQGFKVVGAVRNAGEALRDLQRTRPDVVLLEAGLPDSVRAVAQLRQAVPEVRVIAMNFPPTHEGLVAFIRAGVAGFMLKDGTLEGMVGTIRRVVEGAPALPRVLGGLLFSHLAAQSQRWAGRELRPSARLTRREREVASLIAEGLSNKEIADRLHLATPTVKTHVRGVLEKLALHTRLEVAAYAHSEGAGL